MLLRRLSLKVKKNTNISDYIFRRGFTPFLDIINFAMSRIRELNGWLYLHGNLPRALEIVCFVTMSNPDISFSASADQN